ncbi:hypothetical protein PM082_022294 [Marasmius tenuissimus]|nr:hypothetical protein PM082_022294 [Marasmius tenuissimus]
MIRKMTLAMLITDVGFSLVGTIPNNSTSQTPVYLFVPPVPIERSGGMYSICYPLVNPVFYWSLDPNGEHAISEEDWEMIGIPRLKVVSRIGAWWDIGAYFVVYEHLKMKNHDLRGMEYARERGYLRLVPGDPYKVRVFDWHESDAEKDWSATDPEEAESGDNKLGEEQQAQLRQR